MSPACTILLLGSNESGALEACRSLGRLGRRITILRLTAQRSAADHSRFCAESLYLGTPDSSASQYLSKLTTLLDSRRFDYLIPIDYVACELAYYRYDAISLLTSIVGPNPSAYAIARNRFEALALAESAGLARPETILAKQGQIPPNPQFPCLVKPVFSATIIEDEPQKFSVRKVNSVAELDAKLRDDLARSDVLLQTPIAGEMLELNFCAIDGVVLGVTVTVSLHESNRDGDSSYRKSGEVTPPILAIVHAIAHKLCWSGFMVIECKSHQDKLFLMDIRPYPSDSMSLSRFSGVDFPKLLMGGLTGEKGVSTAIPSRNAYSRNFRKDAYWLYKLMRKKPGAKIIADCLGSFRHLLTSRECLDIERLDDPLPAIRQFDGLISTIADKISLRFQAMYHRLVSPRPDVGSLNKASSLLIVCKGNINRSMVAECLFKAHGFTRVQSAGLLGMSGRKPSRQAETYLAERLGIGTSALRSRSVTRAMREMNGEIDLVLCFERRQIAELIRRFPGLSGKLMLLTELANDKKGPKDIADPHGAVAEMYSAIFSRIEKLVDRIALFAESNNHIADTPPLSPYEN